MNIIFQIEGGLGKSIMATAVCIGIKKKYPKANLIVISAYPDVFLNNPNVYKTYDFNHKVDFYTTYVKDKDVKIFIQDPYHHNNFQTNSEHLFKTWFGMYELEYQGELPKIYLTKVEEEHLGQFYKTDKPIMVFHTNGGPPNTGVAYNWSRDMPESLVFSLIERYKADYNLVQVRRADQLMYPDIMSALDNYRSIAVLLLNSKKRILIDSFTQHLAAALNLPSAVLWVATSPKIFGYEMHQNVEANKFNGTVNYQNSLYQPFNLNEPLTTFPYKDTRDIFDITKVLNAVTKIV